MKSWRSWTKKDQEQKPLLNVHDLWLLNCFKNYTITYTTASQAVSGSSTVTSGLPHWRKDHVWKRSGLDLTSTIWVTYGPKKKRRKTHQFVDHFYLQCLSELLTHRHRHYNNSCCGLKGEWCDCTSPMLWMWTAEWVSARVWHQDRRFTLESGTETSSSQKLQPKAHY